MALFGGDAHRPPARWIRPVNQGRRRTTDGSQLRRRRHVSRGSRHPLYGSRVADLDPLDQDEAATSNLGFAAEAAAKIDAVVLVEPVSGTPAYPVKAAADAIVVIDRVHAQCGVSNVRLLADLYHLHCNGDYVPDVIGSHATRIGHVQIADSPGRGEPGTGTLELGSFLEQLAGQGYRGYVGLEHKPTRSDTFDWMDPALRASRTTIAR